MAFGGAGAVVGAAVIAAGTTVYAANQQKKTAEREMANANNLAAQSTAEANKISLPTGQSTAASLQASEQRAATAGGTMTGPGGMRVGDSMGQPKKSLLGS